MHWYDLIFSDERRYRIKRHVIFWLLWWIYFAATYYYYVQVGLTEIAFGSFSVILILKTFLLILTHILSCYYFIYFLLPFYLLERKYLGLALGICLLIIFLLVAGYYIHAKLFSLIDKEYHTNLATTRNTIWWTSINSVLLNAPKIIAAAAAIKLVKRWYLKQQEKEKAEKEKLIAGLQLLKAQIRPDFLFNSLDHIYRYAKTSSVQAQDLLLKFSDLLSYLLYECDDASVPVEKELNMMKEYMLMEKIRYGDNIEMEITIKGDPGRRTIAPLLLLPFIEYSFKHCRNQVEQPWINLEIAIEKGDMVMKLMNGADAVIDTTIEDENIKNIKTRLNLLYHEKHELKMHTEQEICMTILRIDLDQRPDIQQIASRINLTNNKSLYAYAVN